MQTYLVARRSKTHPETLRFMVDFNVAMQSGIGHTVPLATVEAPNMEVAETMVHEQYGADFTPILFDGSHVPEYVAPTFEEPKPWSPDSN